MSDVVFTRIISEADFPADGKLAAAVNGWTVLVAKVDGAWHAYNDRCPHAASQLSPGRIRRGAILCPLHGAMFSLTTGSCVGGVYRDLRRFEVRVEDGHIAVAVPTTPPGMEDIAIKAG